MNSIFLIVSFVFGSIIGSFLNVVILRLNTGRSIARGRSACLTCNTEIKSKYLFPIGSYFVIGMRCRECRSPLSLQYPLVELLTAILFSLSAWVLWQEGFAVSIFVFYLFSYWLISSLLVAIAVYDLRHKIIPNLLVYLFAGYALIFMLVSSWGEVGFWDLLSGPFLFLPFFLLWYLSGGRWIGLGDGKLALGFGWFLGFVGGLSAVIYGFWLGAIWAIIAIFAQRSFYRRALDKLSFASEVPFAPFLIAGFFIVLFSGLTLANLILL